MRKLEMIYFWISIYICIKEGSILTNLMKINSRSVYIFSTTHKKNYRTFKLILMVIEIKYINKINSNKSVTHIRDLNPRLSLRNSSLKPYALAEHIIILSIIKLILENFIKIYVFFFCKYK